MIDTKSNNAQDVYLYPYIFFLHEVIPIQVRTDLICCCRMYSTTFPETYLTREKKNRNYNFMRQYHSSSWRRYKISLNLEERCIRASQVPHNFIPYQGFHKCFAHCLLYMDINNKHIDLSESWRTHLQKKSKTLGLGILYKLPGVMIHIYICIHKIISRLRVQYTHFGNRASKTMIG